MRHTIIVSRLKELRRIKGWSQTDLAREMNGCKSAINRIEKSGYTATINTKTFVNLCNALQCTDTYIQGKSRSYTDKYKGCIFTEADIMDKIIEIGSGLPLDRVALLLDVAILLKTANINQMPLIERMINMFQDVTEGERFR